MIKRFFEGGAEMPINVNELTKEEAESYLAELEDFELDGDMLKRVAGGGGYADLCWSNTKPILTQ